MRRMRRQRHCLPLKERGEISAPEFAYYVEKVKAFQKGGEKASLEWRTYCATFGRGTHDPGKHDLQFLRKFFELHALGRLPKMGFPLRQRPMPTLESDPIEAHAILVAKVEYLRRRCQWCGDAWIRYKPSILDPREHTSEALCGFLESYKQQSGAALSRDPIAAPVLCPSPLADCIKEMQSSRRAWKTQWNEFCDDHGTGVNHDACSTRSSCSEIQSVMAESMSSLSTAPRAASLGATEGWHMNGGSTMDHRRCQQSLVIRPRSRSSPASFFHRWVHIVDDAVMSAAEDKFAAHRIQMQQRIQCANVLLVSGLPQGCRVHNTFFEVIFSDSLEDFDS